MVKKIKINNQEITIKEYNNLYCQENHPVLKRLAELYDEIYGSRGIGSREEYEKSKKVNRQLFADVENSYNKYCQSKGQNYWAIVHTEAGDSRDDTDARIQQVISRSEQLLDGAQGLVNDMEQLKKQRDATGNEYNEKPYQNPNPDQTREERNKKADDLRKWRAEAKSEIEKVLNQEPKITTSDLDGENQTWEKSLENAILGEDEIKEIKERVLADILKKREVKNEDSGDKGEKRKREDDNDNQENKKPKLDTNELTALITEAKDKDTYDELKPILEKIEKFEGEEVYNQNKAEIEKLKTRLAKWNTIGYKQGIVNKVEERLNNLVDKIGTKGEAITNKLEQLKNSSDLNEINQIEAEINAELGQTEANVVLDRLVNELRDIVKKGKKVSELNSKLEEIKSFSESTNVYQKESYEQRKNAIEQLVSQANNLTEENKGIAPWKVIVPIVSIAVVILVGISIYRFKNKKHNSKNR